MPNILTDIATKINYLERRLAQLETIQIPIGNLIAPYLTLPGLVGLWYAGNVQRSTGNIYDLSGQGRTLTYNGNPKINYLANGIAYADLDGTGDYWSRADETDLDILGTESWPTYPGLTMIIWANIHTLNSAYHGIFGKWLTSGNQAAYILQISNTNLFQAIISSNGITAGASTTITATADTWYFLAVRFTPSTELKLWANSTTASSTASVPASVFNSTAGLGIGSVNGLETHMDWSIAALCANAVPDATIQSLYQRGRVFFGV